MSEGQAWETLVLNFFPTQPGCFTQSISPVLGNSDCRMSHNHRNTGMNSVRAQADLPCPVQTNCDAQEQTLSPKTLSEMLSLLSTQAKRNPWTGTFHEPEEKGCWAESWQQILGE